jgi:hypothetical protein
LTNKTFPDLTILQTEKYQKSMPSTDSTAPTASSDQEPTPMSQESTDQPITQPWPVPPPTPVDPSSPQDRIIKTDEDYGTIGGVVCSADVSGPEIKDTKTDPLSTNDTMLRVVAASVSGSAGQGAESRVRAGFSYDPQVITVTAFPNDREFGNSLEFEIPCTKCGRHIFYSLEKDHCSMHNDTPCAIPELISLCPSHKGHAFRPSIRIWVNSGSKINIDPVDDSGAAAEDDIVQSDIVQSDDDEKPVFKSPAVTTVQVKLIEYVSLKKQFTLRYSCPLCFEDHTLVIEESPAFNPKSVSFVAGPPLSFDHVCHCGPLYQPLTVRVSLKIWQMSGCNVYEAPVNDPSHVMIRNVLLDPHGMAFAVFTCPFCIHHLGVRKSHAYSIGTMVNLDLRPLARIKDAAENIAGTPALLCSMAAGQPEQVKLSLSKWRFNGAALINVDTRGFPMPNEMTAYAGEIPLLHVDHEEENAQDAYKWYLYKIKDAAGGGSSAACHRRKRCREEEELLPMRGC